MEWKGLTRGSGEEIGLDSSLLRSVVWQELWIQTTTAISWGYPTRALRIDPHTQAVT
jgi:hypothetical protein